MKQMKKIKRIKKIKKINEYRIHSKLLNGVLLLLLPLLVLCCVECYTHVPQDLTIPIFFLNAAFYYLLFFVCIFLTGNSGRGCALATVLPMIYGLINYVVVDFRSSPVVPWDLYSIGTAVSVAGNYKIEITPRLLAVLAGFLVLILLGSRTGIRVKHLRVRVAGFLLSVMCMFGYVHEIGTDSWISFFGLDTTLFTPNVLYRNNGLAGGFLSILKYIKVEKPQGYSAEEVQKIASEYPAEETKKEISELPNVIVIMDEAFSDLSVLGEFATDSDYMPFIHSLTENTIKGNCYVSVKGGNTANSEYEFLTGDSMAFMPTGSVPYQQYVKGEMPTMASYLKDLGYITNAIHPYNKSGWARDKVYPWFGFDNLLFKTDFENAELIRSYISDQSAFEKIVELYEAKDADERMFTFEVTMQNHGGYSKDVEGFEESVFLTDLDNKTTSVRAAEKYLTLIQETDQAFQYLVEYFSEQDEDTIILLFGDHQPSDYVTNVILRVLGLEREENDEVYFNNYIVPFVIWANFDIEEAQVEYTSVNYLGTMLMEQANIPLTGYQTFLKELQEEIPVITANMIMDRDGNRYRYDERENIDEELLKKYRMLVYNHLADREGRVDGFFE